MPAYPIEVKAQNQAIKFCKKTGKNLQTVTTILSLGNNFV
jgi:hypothetical protein